MSVKTFIKKYLLVQDRHSMIEAGVFIAITQIFIFLIVSGSRIGEMTYLSLITIICTAFFFGELAGLLFAVAVAMCFSPLWLDLNGYGSAWWVARAFSFAAVGLVVGGLSTALKGRLNFEENISHIDISTGLPSRLALCEKLLELSKTQANGLFAMVVVIISNRKKLSETFGNEVTKSIFNQFRDRCMELTKKAKAEIETYSIGPDQIAFFFRKNEGINLEVREKFEDSLMDIAKKNFLHNGFFIHADSHLGLYRFSDFSEINQGELPLRYAEEAADTAVKQMKDLVVYGPSNLAQNPKYSKATDILGEIDLAIRSRWMFLVYQPKIDMATGKIHSVEALIRWNHPTRGFVPPGLFIPQAEQSTLIENITDFVIRQAILQLKLWQRSGIYVNIAVNISTYNLLQPNFVNKVFSLLKEKNLPPECLEIEVTEGSLISDFQHVIDSLNRFHDAKIKIFLDDFGTGYSSFQYLQRLPIDYLKIDQSFVRNLGANRESKEIVKAIIDLAHTIDIKTVAEGVETLSDYEYLNNVKCDVGQGYFMSKPLTSNNFVSWYSENNGVFKISNN
jgi:EAL domain-containing protein (putative c-di-GMP-specific phosphodiesterase class I)/GGDEF domain-containing protein